MNFHVNINWGEASAICAVIGAIGTACAKYIRSIVREELATFGANYVVTPTFAAFKEDTHHRLEILERVL